VSAVEWTDGQSKALKAFESFLGDFSSSVFLLRGPAGTGKSELIAAFVEESQRCDRPIRLLAPTGQASRRLSRRIGEEVSTVHAAIYVRSSNIDNGEDAPPTAVFSLATDRPVSQVTVIDESSLVGDTVTEPIDQKPAVRYGSGRLLSDVLDHCLGGSGKVVMVGDPHQLPAFGEQHAVALEPATFTERGIGVVVVDLDEVVRQASGSAIAILGASLRERCESGAKVFPTFEDGIELQRLKPPMSPELFDRVSEEDGIVLAWRNADVGRWNRHIREHRGARSVLPTPGDRLITVQASPALHLLNGDEIVISKVHETETIHLRGDEVTLVHCDIKVGESTSVRTQLVVDVLESPSQEVLRRVTRLLWVDFVIRMRDQGIERNRDRGRFWESADSDPRWNAIRATYSYARTVYRAQGGEWGTVVFDASGVKGLGRNGLRLAYTGVTRAKGHLHVRNWPLADRVDPITSDKLADEVRAVVQEVTGRTLEVRLLDSAASPTVQIRDVEGVLSVNVHSRKGEPSTIVVQKGAGEPWVEELRLGLEMWIAARRAETHPAPDEVLDLLAPVCDHLGANGVDLRIWQESDYVVGVELLAECWRHVASYHHDAGGRLTKRRSNGSGDPQNSDLERMFEELIELGGAEVECHES